MWFSFNSWLTNSAQSGIFQYMQTLINPLTNHPKYNEYFIIAT